MTPSDVWSDPELTRLRQKWEPAWQIWRARRQSDEGDRRTGEFVATQMEEMPGMDPTVMCPTADELDATLAAGPTPGDHTPQL